MDSNLVNHPQPNNVASTSPPSVATSHASSDSAIELSIIRIAEERLRQARYSFVLALVMTATCAIIGFVGVGLLWSGQAPEGTITAVGGMASSIHCFRLAKDANNRLDLLETALFRRCQIEGRSTGSVFLDTGRKKLALLPLTCTQYLTQSVGFVVTRLGSPAARPSVIPASLLTRLSVTHQG